MMKTIILLDDDPDEQVILRDAFATLDIPVQLRQFYIFSDLLNHLGHATTLPDLLLLDINMPGISGVEALELLKSQQRFERLPVVMHSSSSDRHLIQQCFSRGAIAYIKKTTDTETLHHHLRVLMKWTTQQIFDGQRGNEIVLA